MHVANRAAASEDFAVQTRVGSHLAHPVCCRVTGCSMLAFGDATRRQQWNMTSPQWLQLEAHMQRITDLDVAGRLPNVESTDLFSNYILAYGIEHNDISSNSWEVTACTSRPFRRHLQQVVVQRAHHAEQQIVVGRRRGPNHARLHRDLGVDV